MTTPNKAILAGAVVLSLLGAIAFFGFSPFIKTVVQQTFGSSPNATSFSNAKFAGKTFLPQAAGNDATTSSILNTDTFDRYVTGFRVACETVGTSKSVGANNALTQNGWNFSIGTSSVANPVGSATTSFAAVAMNVSLSTTTTNTVVASSTLQTATSSNAMVWPTNTYETFSVNATNTTASGCNWGVDYIGS